MTSAHGRKKPAPKKGARRHGVAVSEIQRARILTAATVAVEEEGYAVLTVTKIVERARISRKTFYEIFDDVEDCFLAVFDLTLSRAREAIDVAYRSEQSWRGGMRAGVLAMLMLLDEEPGLARVCVVEAFAGGQPVLERRAEVLAELAHAIDLGRALSGVDHQPEAMTGLAVAGGIAELLHAQLLRDDGSSATRLHGTIMSMIVMPYLGRSAAREESKLPRPRAALAVSRPAEEEMVKEAKEVNPLAGMNIRLTYRTVRVLIAISELPGASNRQVAMEAGIVDQGQISKLLRRLESLGLVENTGMGQPRGVSNAWYLTALGARVRRAAQGH